MALLAGRRLVGGTDTAARPLAAPARVPARLGGATTRPRVARPLSASAPADKGSVAVQQAGGNGSVTVKVDPNASNAYIAGPFGSGRLSVDGALTRTQPTLALGTHGRRADCAVLGVLSHCSCCPADGMDDILEVPSLRHMLEARCVCALRCGHTRHPGPWRRNP
jgi:hypothetical protein